MGKTFLGVLGASVLAGSLLVSATAQAEDKVFGWVENAYIEPWVGGSATNLIRANSSKDTLGGKSLVFRSFEYEIRGCDFWSPCSRT